MKNSIYKLQNGKYVDLSKIVEIGEVSYDLYETFYAQFPINYQLKEQPCYASWKSYDIIPGLPWGEQEEKAIQVVEGYRQELVNAWKEYNLSVN